MLDTANDGAANATKFDHTRLARLTAHYAEPLTVLRAVIRADLLTRPPGADTVTVDCDILPADQVARLCANATACPLVIGEDWQVEGVEGGRVTLVLGGVAAERAMGRAA